MDDYFEYEPTYPSGWIASGQQFWLIAWISDNKINGKQLTYYDSHLN